MELACHAAPHQFAGIHECGWLVEALPEGLPDQRAIGQMTTAHALMDIREQHAPLFPCDAFQEGPIRASVVAGGLPSAGIASWGRNAGHPAWTQGATFISDGDRDGWLRQSFFKDAYRWGCLG